MGSIEIYDTTKGQWVPYVPDYEKWIQNFRDISEGRVRPDHKGRYIVGSGSRSRDPPTKLIDQPKVALVIPVAQALEMTKLQLKREQKKLLEYSDDDGRRKRYKQTKMDKLCF
jgi:hypothetical protein